ncbi:hypothetical protein Dfri01_44170 [Dyadobacter frigoris]|uniref:Gliding motility-associated protein GldM C-terminal domain-containing protein n=1 Tax=Dyadobacter frigoris TaxID=2576211 RepID=A0A4U6CVD5_9BACT|nr:hypothetical protein [Dyadobacter frigoris]TKT88622.1 hypothetical protein FDK13_27135 [Dyadobacter frigoris]GLU54956.1 hypothetical protein Dfri01_44170 [Dyadobacter frigoris]
MIQLKLFIAFILLTTNINSFGQTITDPIDVPYFVIKRKTANVLLPESLGGKSVKGFAGITIAVNSLGKVQHSEMVKLKLSGKVNLSYQPGQDVKSDTVLKFETFILKNVSKIKIIKTDKRKPPKLSTITFLVRF